MMKKNSKIYVAGHTGMVGSAIVRKLKEEGYNNIIGRTLEELDLTNQQAVIDFFETERPEYVFLAAAKVGGILANNTYRAQFIYENLMIQNNIIHNSYVFGVKKLLFMGSSCIYPKNCLQPIKEEYLLTGELEQTNEPYAIAKIAGIKMCESYYRQYGCNFISVMPTNLYGPNDNYDLKTSHALPAIIRKLHLGRCIESGDWNGLRKDLQRHPIDGISGTNSETEILKILKKYGVIFYSPGPETLYKGGCRDGSDVAVTLWGTGKVYREFMHVEDMAAACIFMFEKIDTVDLAACIVELKQGENLQINQYSNFINIGTGSDLTIMDVAKIIQAITQFSGKIFWDHAKPDGTKKKQLDITLLQKLGFQSRYTLEEGIRDVYSKYQKK